MRTRPLVALSALALLALGAASTTIGAEDKLRSVHYVCPDGERFSVEYKKSNARLRNGSGVFSLAADPADHGRRFSDGTLTLSPHDGGATLQRVGQHPDDCASEPRRS
ncbi:MAG: hypothetical protein JNJ44_10160 [Zoogloeaceae bacterium]|nr:hypothetical protein [Zoogloeaceae bacterium]